MIENFLNKLYKASEPKISKLILILIFNLTTGLKSEEVYWHYILLRRHGYRESKRLNRGERKKIFPKKLLQFIKQKDKPLLLEIGSGPLSDLAWGVENNLFDIITIDPLAKVYNKLMKRYKIDYPIKPVEGTGEELSTLFDKNQFSIVYSRNALDHTFNPQLCIKNMVAVLKNKGFLYICGNVKEGTKVHWQGLHKHDLVLADGNLCHYNQEGKMTNLTKDLNIKLVYKSKTGDSPGNWFTVVFQKNE